MSDSPLDKAQEFLISRELIALDGSNKLLFFNGHFYLYDERKWIVSTLDDIEDDVINLAVEKPSFMQKTPDRLVRDVVRNLRAICKVNNLRIGYPISGEICKRTHYIPLQNGILKLEINNKVLNYSLGPASSNIFNTYLLPYEYNPQIPCDMFLHFMSEVLSPQEVSLVQEWFGYCLIPVNLANKLMIFYGLGANGKSVILLILKLLLGEENVSYMPLQSFLPESRFGLAATEGKLANIAEEIDEDINAASGLLKMFTGGDAVPVERKYKEGFLIKPTARLTFGTNSLPRFKDDSDGLIRRMIILPFKRQFLDERKQNKNFIDRDFWLESGELSGIFNWALEGLNRLVSNNWKFTEPQSVMEVMESYKNTINPTIQFLKDYLELDANGQISVVELYQNYSEHCRTFGIIRSESSSFGRNIRKVFPHVTQSANALKVGNIRSRVWYGLKFKNDDIFEHSHPQTLLTQKNQENLSIQAVSRSEKEDL